MTATCSGDIGDYVFFLGVLSEIPHGPHRSLLQSDQQTKYRDPNDLPKLHQVVAPLALKQSYISECRIIQDGDQVDWRSQDFRGKGLWVPQVTLLGAKSYHLQTVKGFGAKIKGVNRWLHNITPNPYSRGRVIVNRTGRYRNAFFPWRQIVNHYGDRLLFVGLAHEYHNFCGEWGAVEFIKTENLLQVAELIEGSALFIGNQSSANAVAEGLKHPMIQETCLSVPDCIFKRPNAQHVGDGGCSLPDVDGSGILNIPPTSKEQYVFKTHKTPPDGWQYGDKKQLAWIPILNEVKRLPEFRGKSEEAVATAVMEENWRRKPEFFKDTSYEYLFATYREALKNASSF